MCCSPRPVRSVATVALQFPDLAAEQLEEGIKKYGLRGANVGGSVAGNEISDLKFHPFLDKAEEWDAMIFIHPQGDTAPAQLGQRFKGNGYLSNVIGNPLETTIALSHLISKVHSTSFRGSKSSLRTPVASYRLMWGVRITGVRPGPTFVLVVRTVASRRNHRST
jgi:aminocarboxymuconate-semialdehyde decarboxylase